MGTKQQTIVEINGKRYDTRTGQLVVGADHPKVAAKPKTLPRPVSDIARPQPIPAKRRTLQRSQTLMRTGMKRPVGQKPAATAVKKVKARTVSDFRLVKSSKHTALPAAGLAEREARAKQIKQSKLVHRFSSADMVPAARPVVPKVQALPVQPEPLQHQPLKLKTPHNAESLIAKGLQRAQSHTQAPVKKSRTKKRSRLASAMAVSLAVLLLGGFIMYQNIPNLSMRYAAARSGVSATLPSYAPSGFALSNRIQYNPGQITVNFSSNTDERNFSITQRESNWNSDTLMSNYVATTNEPVQTYEDKGRTIYLYGDSNATWVNGGVWYEIKSEAQLTSDQLIRIATSM